MAAVYTRRLVLRRFTASTDQIVYSAPATGAVVVRDIVVANSSATALAQVTLMIRPVAGPLDVVIGLWKDMPFGVQHVDLRQVLEVGDSLRFVAPAIDVSLAITGYVFE